MAGGKRNGAGRPRGRKDTKPRRKTREGKALAKEEITPLSVMKKAMLEHFEAERWDAAAAVAKDMAPYVHAKLTSVKIGGDGENPVPVTFIEVRRAATGGGSDPA